MAAVNHQFQWLVLQCGNIGAAQYMPVGKNLDSRFGVSYTEIKGAAAQGGRATLSWRYCKF
jgi:hypothetical protein